MDNSRNAHQDKRKHAVHSCSMKDEFQKANDKGQDSPGATMAITTTKGLSLGEDMTVLFLSRPLCSHDQINHVLALQQHKTRHIPQYELGAKH